MLPKSVTHKKNGHARPPAIPAVSSAEMLHRVHSLRDHTAPRIGPDLLRFAHLIRTERGGLLFAQAAHEIDGLRSALAEAVARTTGPLEHGELEDVRRMLARLREDAEGVARLVGMLAAAVEVDADERRVLNLDDVVDRALTLPALRPPGLTVVRRCESGLPPVAGHRARSGDGTVTIETSSRPAQAHGARLVRLRIVDERAVTPSDIDLRAAAAIAREHGGILATELIGEGRLAYIVDLPAL
jgi:hypothetical protein